MLALILASVLTAAPVATPAQPAPAVVAPPAPAQTTPAPTAPPAPAADVAAEDPHANMDQFTLYMWKDSRGVRQYTDDPKRAPKNATTRVVYSSRPATSTAAPVAPVTP